MRMYSLKEKDMDWCEHVQLNWQTTCTFLELMDTTVYVKKIILQDLNPIAPGKFIGKNMNIHTTMMVNLKYNCQVKPVLRDHSYCNLSREVYSTE